MARTNNLNNFLTDVASAIREKKGSTDLIKASDFDTEIESITTGDVTLGKKEITTNGIYKASDDNLGGYSEVDVNVEMSYKWQRPSDWYDLPKILSEAEPIEYESKTYYPRLALQLMITNDETTEITLGSMLSSVYNSTLIVTSDGQQFTNSNYIITITFDKSKDKATRYILVYDSLPSASNTFSVGNITNQPIIEIVLGGTAEWLNIVVGSSNGSNIGGQYLRNFEMLDTAIQSNLNSNYCFTNTNTLEHIKIMTTQAGTLSSNYYATIHGRTLKELEMPNLTTFGKSMISNIYGLERVYLPNLESTTTTFTGCYNLKELIVPKLKTLNTTSFLQNVCYLEKLSLPSIETGVPVLTNSNNLKEVELPNDFKISGWSFSTCYKLTKETLLDVLNKLADVTEDTATTYSITFGTVNLSKLTEDELAIGTNKGWVIS